MTKFSILLMFTVVVSGCYSWPDSSGGGLAEVSPYVVNTTSNDAYGISVENIKSGILKAEKRLDTLKIHGAKECLTALYITTQQLLIRTKREFSGRLFIDASKDLQRVDRGIDSMNMKMNKLIDRHKCIFR